MVTIPAGHQGALGSTWVFVGSLGLKAQREGPLFVHHKGQTFERVGVRKLGAFEE